MARLAGWLGAVGVAGVLAAAAGCAPVDSGGTGFVRVLVTQGSERASGGVALRVTLREVFLIPKGTGPADGAGIEMRGGPIAIPGDLEIDLAELRAGRTVLIASQRAPAGDYAQVRLVVASAAVIRRGDTESDPVAVTAVDLTGVRVDVPSAFTLRDGEIQDVTLDIDAEASARALEAGGDRGIVVRPAVSSVARIGE